MKQRDIDEDQVVKLAGVITVADICRRMKLQRRRVDRILLERGVTAVKRATAARIKPSGSGRWLPPITRVIPRGC